MTRESCDSLYHCVICGASTKLEADLWSTIMSYVEADLMLIGFDALDFIDPAMTEDQETYSPLTREDLYEFHNDLIIIGEKRNLLCRTDGEETGGVSASDVPGELFCMTDVQLLPSRDGTPMIKTRDMFRGGPWEMPLDIACTDLESNRRQWHRHQYQDFALSKPNVAIALHRQCFELLQAKVKFLGKTPITARTLFVGCLEEKVTPTKGPIKMKTEPFVRSWDLNNEDYDCFNEEFTEVYMKSLDTRKVDQCWKHSLAIHLSHIAWEVLDRFPIEEAFLKAVTKPLVRIKYRNTLSQTQSPLSTLPVEVLQEIVLATNSVKSAQAIGSTCKMMRRITRHLIDRVAYNELCVESPACLPWTPTEKRKWHHTMTDYNWEPLLFHDGRQGSKEEPFLKYLMNRVKTRQWLDEKSWQFAIVQLLRAKAMQYKDNSAETFPWLCYRAYAKPYITWSMDKRRYVWQNIDTVYDELQRRGLVV